MNFEYDVVFRDIAIKTVWKKVNSFFVIVRLVFYHFEHHLQHDCIPARSLFLFHGCTIAFTDLFLYSYKTNKRAVTILGDMDTGLNVGAVVHPCLIVDVDVVFPRAQAGSPA
jgi:hypothetical protein